MAAVVPEIIEGAAVPAAEGAGEGAAQARQQRQEGRQNRMRAPAAPRQARQGTPPRGGQRRERQFSQQLRRTGRGALKARLPGSHSYQPVILAEFLTAVIVVSVSPLAKGGKTSIAQAKSSPSPYDVNTLKQLVAIGGAYFVLALLASSRRAGRFAAWFGGLILLGLGFTQLANGDLTALFKIFAPGGPDTSGGGAQALGSPLIAPGVAAADAQAAQNALGPNLADSGQAATTTTNISFGGQPGVYVSDTGSGTPGLA